MLLPATGLDGTVSSRAVTIASAAPPGAVATLTATRRPGPATTAATRPQPAARSATAGPAPSHGAPLTAFDVEGLLTDGRLRLEHPAGGSLEVVVDGQPRALPGGRQIAVRSDGLPGLISQRGQRLLVTLATARGSYRLESRHGSLDVVDQQLLDWRTWQRPEDYRVVPR